MNEVLQMDANLHPVMRECTIYNDGDNEMFFMYTFKQYLKNGDSSMLFSLALTRNRTLIQRYFYHFKSIW